MALEEKHCLSFLNILKDYKNMEKSMDGRSITYQKGIYLFIYFPETMCLYIPFTIEKHFYDRFNMQPSQTKSLFQETIFEIFNLRIEVN